MKKIIFLILTMITVQSQAVEWAVVAGGRSTTGDASTLNVPSYTNASATNIEGGILTSFNLPIIFFRTGLLYIPRTETYNLGSGASLNYTMNCLDVPAWVGAKFGFFGIFAGADFGFKMSSSSGGTNAVWAGGTTFNDNSTFVAPQVGIDFSFAVVRVSVFYEAQTTISTASNAGATAALRGTAIGALAGVYF